MSPDQSLRPVSVSADAAGSSSSGGTRVIEHNELCPLGRGATRWYLCSRHSQALLFQAGSGRLDAVANSCPVCGNLSMPFHGCACRHAEHPLDRSKRPGRRIKRKFEAQEEG